MLKDPETGTPLVVWKDTTIRYENPGTGQYHYVGVVFSESILGRNKTHYDIIREIISGKHAIEPDCNFRTIETDDIRQSRYTNMSYWSERVNDLLLNRPKNDKGVLVDESTGELIKTEHQKKIDEAYNTYGYWCRRYHSA